MQIVSLRVSHELSRRHTEQHLLESETRYRAIVEDQTELVVRWKPDGTRTFVNDAYCRFFEQTREALIGVDFYSLVVEEDRQQIREKLARLTPAAPLEIDIHRVIKPDGSIGWQEWVDRGLFDESGHLTELQSVGRDITERSLMSEQVRLERDRAQQYLDIAGVILVVVNERAETTLINHKGRELLGYSEEELIGRQWFEMCLPEREFERVYRSFKQILAGRVAVRDHYESHIVTKAGEERLISWRIQVLHDAAGHVVGALSSGEDITERRLAEDALREQTELAEALSDIAALINSSLDPRRVFDRILMNLIRVVPHDFADIMMIDAGVARVVSFHCWIDVELDEVLMRSVRLPLDETANLRRMVETGQPLIVPDTQEFAEWVDISETRWIRSYMGAPIRVGGETIGFINVNSTKPCFFTEQHVSRLQAFADQAAIAINNAHSYDDLERRVIERTIDLSVRNAVAETLSNTLEIEPMLNGVLRTTVERIGVHGGAIHLLSDDGTTLSLAACYGISPETLEQVTGFTPGGADLGAISPASRALNTRPPNIPNETGIYAVLSVPIWRQGQIQGIIT
ncbi:MAG: PAS domain S-box protein, partial [Chloroflexi bacterium]